MEFYSSDFLTISMKDDKETIYFTWSDATKILTEERFRRELHEEIKILKEKKPKNILIDTYKFAYLVLPETQKWVDVEIYPAWAEAGVTKVAIIMAAEFISQMSIEQSIEENSQESMHFNFFEDEDKALAWLKN